MKTTIELVREAIINGRSLESTDFRETFDKHIEQQGRELEQRLQELKTSMASQEKQNENHNRHGS